MQRNAPLKRKNLRGNHAAFMTKELSKAIMDRSRLKSKYLKSSCRENLLAFKCSKQRCENLNKGAKKEYFEKASEGNTVNNKDFWKSISPFLTNKNAMKDDFITLQEGKNYEQIN